LPEDALDALAVSVHTAKYFCRSLAEFAQGETKMKLNKSVVAALAVAVLIAGLSGCKEGPVERAGKQVDKAVDKVKDAVKK